MNFDEWENGYYKGRPVEPNSRDEKPDEWCAILDYAESSLKKAYNAGVHSTLMMPPKGTDIKAWQAEVQALMDKVFEDMHLLVDVAYRGGALAVRVDNANRSVMKDRTRWHYPSKGEMPKDGEDILLFFAETDDIKYFRLGYRLNDMWRGEYNNNISDEGIVIAWQYLPEPPEEQKNAQSDS